LLPQLETEIYIKKALYRWETLIGSALASGQAKPAGKGQAGFETHQQTVGSGSDKLIDNHNLGRF
jgi:hypothetical protein